MRTMIFLLLWITSGIAYGEPYPWELLKDKEFSQLYRSSIAQYQQEHWLRKLSGPSHRASRISVEGVEYLLVHSCKIHSCNANNVVILYSSSAKRVYGLVFEEGSLSFFGNPSTAIQNDLRKFYAQHYSASADSRDTN